MFDRPTFLSYTRCSKRLRCLLTSCAYCNSCCRIIWGYKILMLDVLFPLSVNKIIYIDSDQVSAASIASMCPMIILSPSTSSHQAICVHVSNFLLSNISL